MPSLPTESGDGDIEIMQGVRMVMEYGNLSYHEALELPTDVFLLMRKNRYIELLNETREGREYLEKCERIAISEPDEDGLKRLQGILK